MHGEGVCAVSKCAILPDARRPLSSTILVFERSSSSRRIVLPTSMTIGLTSRSASLSGINISLATRSPASVRAQ